MIVAFLLGLGLALQEPSAPAGSARFVRVEVECTALAGESVYLDHGRDAGLEPGDRLRLFAAQGPARIGKIVSVSRSGARASMDDGLEGLDVGVRGEVLVPRARLARARAAPEPVEPGAPEPEPAPGPQPRAIEHPPWTAPPEEWNRELPLLAPAHGVAPEERAQRFRGQLTTSSDWTRDSSGSSERRFLSSTLGLEGRVENPFASGGELGFDAELFTRSSDTGTDTTHDARLRLQRLSFAWGGVRGERSRGEVGRFLPREFPEFGFLDGVEYVKRTAGGHRLGASFGFLPEPDDLFRSGSDLEAALFGRWVSGDDERAVLGAGIQKTWHEGVADRDLLAAHVELHPDGATTVFTSLLVDAYTSGDALKGAGLELTQFFVNATHRGASGSGAGLFASRFRFPELARNEFDSVAAEDIADARNDRVGLDGWVALGHELELYGRVERWADQDDSGGGGRARVTWREAFGRGGPLLLESYLNQGKFTETVGVRASGRKRFERGSLGLSWDATEFDQDGVDERLLQHALRADYEVTVGGHWFLALYTESRFGDGQDALSFGFLLQRSLD